MPFSPRHNLTGKVAHKMQIKYKPTHGSMDYPAAAKSWYPSLSFCTENDIIEAHKTPGAAEEADGRTMKNVVLLDWDYAADWDFVRGLEQATGEAWTVEQCVSNTNYGGRIQRLIRYCKYFWAPLRIFRHRGEYSCVVAWQQFYGLVLAFYCWLFRVKDAPKIVVMTFIYRPRSSLAGALYKRFVRGVIASGYVACCVVGSRSEKKYYAGLLDVNEKIFAVVPLGWEDKTREIPPQSGDFYLAAGRSNRDYAFLVSAWRPEYGRLKIVCDTLTAKDTESIVYLRNCHDDAYFAQLAACRAVIIPLDDTRISSGQSVALQAMMYGKPVIVTENETLSEYVADNEDGFVIAKTAQALEEALRALSDPAVYERISCGARRRYEKEYSAYTMGMRTGNAIKLLEISPA